MRLLGTSARCLRECGLEGRDGRTALQTIFEGVLLEAIDRLRERVSLQPGMSLPQISLRQLLARRSSLALATCAQTTDFMRSGLM